MIHVYHHTFTVPREAIDGHGHANNVFYVQWMQDAAVSHSKKSGCTQVTESLGATWIVHSHRIKYFLPAFLNDQINVLTWVSHFRRVRSLRKYKFVRVADGAVLAEGETDWVFVDAKSAGPRVIPDEIKTVLKAVPVDKEP